MTTLLNSGLIADRGSRARAASRRERVCLAVMNEQDSCEPPGDRRVAEAPAGSGAEQIAAVSRAAIRASSSALGRATATRLSATRSVPSAENNRISREFAGGVASHISIGIVPARAKPIAPPRRKS